MEVRITSRGPLFAHLTIEVFQACDPWQGQKSTIQLPTSRLKRILVGPETM